MDKYPKIPSFLARRLAEANLHRVERLHRADDVQHENVEMPAYVSTKAPLGLFPPMPAGKLRDLDTFRDKENACQVQAQIQAEM